MANSTVEPVRALSNVAFCPAALCHAKIVTMQAHGASTKLSAGETIVNQFE